MKKAIVDLYRYLGNPRDMIHLERDPIRNPAACSGCNGAVEPELKWSYLCNTQISGNHPQT
jgi:hypothetical protein